MLINRENYETVFLLYLDHELAAQDRLAVESFLNEHPDLKVEFELLRETLLTDDPLPEFSHKEGLYRTTSQVTTEDLLLLLDRELSEPEAESLQHKIAGSEGLRADFALLQQTRLDSDDEILFPWKAQLYRSEQSRVIGFRKWHLAAAAVLALALLWSGLRYFRQSSDTPLTETAALSSGTSGQKQVPGLASGKNGIHENQLHAQRITSDPIIPDASSRRIIDGPDQLAIQSSQTTAVVNSGSASSFSNSSNANGAAADDTNNANVNTTALNVKSKTGSNLNENSTVNTQTVVDARMPEVAATKDPVVRETTANYLVQTSFSEPAETLGSFEDGDESKPKKGKLRGLLKRMKRVVERNAHIGNSEGEIKVANLSFAAN